MRRLGVAALALLAAGITPPGNDELDEFYFEGRPIHPAAVQEFVGWLCDVLPVVAALDLEGAMDSERYLDTVIQRDGWVRYERGPESFEYRHVGRTRRGTHVLETRSGLLFVRFDRGRIQDQGIVRERTLMTCIGRQASSGRVSVDGGRLTVDGVTVPVP